MFPTCSEILEVIRDLGYVKTDITGNAAKPATEGDSNINEFDASDETLTDEMEVVEFDD